jgi:DNA-binding transcriptional ArsR family regulator
VAPTLVGDSDLSAVGALLAEPTRAKVLLALADGRSLAASVLAAEAGVAPSTATHHLTRLLEGGLITVQVRGRHRYFSLAGPHIAELIEAIARVAPMQQVTSLREGTRAHSIRYARRCYDHLAGRLGVAVSDAFERNTLLIRSGDPGIYTVTDHGARAFADLGVAARAGEIARCCLDWTEQRPHIAGPLGRTLLSRLLELDWLLPDRRTRALRISDRGNQELRRLGIELP